MENSEKILKAIKAKQKNNTYEVMAIYNAKDKYIFSMYLKKDPYADLIDNLYCIDKNLKNIKEYSTIDNPKELTEATSKKENIIYVDDHFNKGR